MMLAWVTGHLCISHLFPSHTKDVSTQWQQRVWWTTEHGAARDKIKGESGAGRRIPGQMELAVNGKRYTDGEVLPVQRQQLRKKVKDGKPPRTVTGNRSYTVVLKRFRAATRGQPFLPQCAPHGSWTHGKPDYSTSPGSKRGSVIGARSSGTSICETT